MKYWILLLHENVPFQQYQELCSASERKPNEQLLTKKDGILFSLVVRRWGEGIQGWDCSYTMLLRF